MKGRWGCENLQDPRLASWATGVPLPTGAVRRTGNADVENARLVTSGRLVCYRLERLAYCCTSKLAMTYCCTNKPANPLKKTPQTITAQKIQSIKPRFIVHPPLEHPASPSPESDNNGHQRA